MKEKCEIIKEYQAKLNERDEDVYGRAIKHREADFARSQQLYEERVAEARRDYDQRLAATRRDFQAKLEERAKQLAETKVQRLEKQLKAFRKARQKKRQRQSDRCGANQPWAIRRLCEDNAAAAARSVAAAAVVRETKEASS